MEFFGLSLLVGVDIILGMLYRYWDSMKPKPLTFLEFFNFSYDQQQEIIKIIKSENKDIDETILNNYLKTRDLINKKDGKN